MPSVSIIIPTYSNSKGVRECLQSIIDHTNLANVEIIVVANGAPEATKEIEELYREFPVKLIWIPDACGYTHATNVGIEAATGDYLILLNDDCIILGSHWIQLLLQPFLDDPLTGITGPLMLHCPDADQDFIVFFCAMISRKCIESIGALDEIYNPGYGEDCDMACRARKVGWKVVQVPSSQAQLVEKGCEDLPEWKRDKMWHNPFPIYHDGNQTFGKDPEKYDQVLRRNAKVLRERYRVNTVDPNECKCGAPIVDGVCLGAENKPNCGGLNLWRAAQIDGWFGVDEMHRLAGWIKGLPQRSKIVSVGAWHGRSSRCIADNLPEGAQLWDVDTWNGSSGEPEMHGSAHLDRGDHAFQWYFCNLQEHIEAGRVVPVRMDSGNAAHTLGHLIEKGQMDKFSLCFLDGDHSGEGIKRDIESWLPLLKNGAIMCGHDYYPEGEEPFAWMGVRQEVQAHFPSAEKFATSLWYVKSHEVKSEPERGRVFDCFLFHNELDVLEIRLATLYDHVDHFVLVEAGETHSGESKPLHFDLNKERFAKYLDKIRHVVIDRFPEFEGSVYDKAWARERYQRDACMLALADAQPNDVVIIGDADEIASPEAVRNYSLDDGIVRLKQRMFYYYLNCENKEGWDWQKIAPFSEVKRLTPCGIRYPPAGELKLVEPGGWHFSMMGGAEQVRQKIHDYSHREYCTEEILAGVDAAISESRDVFGRGLKYEIVEIDDSYPACLRDNELILGLKGLIKVPLPINSDRGLTLQGNVIKLDKGTKLLVGPLPLKPDDIPDDLRFKSPDLSRKRWTVTAEVSTKDRYTTTLPTCLATIINQTRLPDKLKIYDDGEQANLFELAPFSGLLRIAQGKGIEVEVLSTPRLGQVANHQHCLDNATTDFIWRVDDDELPEPDCLGELLNTVRDFDGGKAMEQIGAVGGLVHHPGTVSDLPHGVDGSLSDIAAGLSLQWFNWNGGVRRVDHLYSTFLINVELARAAGGYPRNLSPVGHREESILTHSIKRAGYEVLCTPWTKTYHLREESGGIRSNPNPAFWEHDEHEWQRLLKTWDAVTPETKLIIADYGLGDHLLLRGIWPELCRKFPERKWVIALCFPEVFKDVPDVTIISIADAKLLVGEKYAEYSLYKFCWDAGWSSSIVDAMMEFYSR